MTFAWLFSASFRPPTTDWSESQAHIYTLIETTTREEERREKNQPFAGKVLLLLMLLLLSSWCLEDRTEQSTQKSMTLLLDKWVDLLLYRKILIKASLKWLLVSHWKRTRLREIEVVIIGNCDYILIVKLANGPRRPLAGVLILVLLISSLNFHQCFS